MPYMRARRQGTKLPDGRWQVRVSVTHPNGAKTLKAFNRPTQREAQNAALTYEKELTEGTPRLDMTLGQLLDWWLENHVSTKKPKTIKQYEGTIKLHIRPPVGKDRRDYTTIEHANAARWAKQCRDLGSDDIEAMMEPALAAKHPRTANLIRVIMRTALRHAQRKKVVSSNVAELALSVPYERQVRPRLTDPIIVELVSCMPNPVFAVFFTLLPEWGLRIDCEALGLTRRDVVEDGKHGHLLLINDSKTEAGKRALPISKRQIALLDSIRHPNSIMLFPNLKGRRYHYRTAAQAWQDAFTAANAKRKQDNLPALPYTNSYQTRHYLGTKMYNQRVPEHITKAVMGHKSPATTRQYYVHGDVDAMREAMGTGTDPGEIKE